MKRPSVFRCGLLALSFLATSLWLTPQASAQVVNSSPSATSATSQVTMSVAVPSVVIVRVNAATSVLSKSFSPSLIDSTTNIVAQDFTILGDVIVNSPTANVRCTLSTLRIALVNGTDTINANITGTIGGTAVNTTAFTPTFSSRKAAINIRGDIDESTVTSLKAPGNYTGTLTITATLL